MRKVLLLIALPLLMSFDLGSKLLSKLTFYEKDSYFKKQVYAEKSWQDFYGMKEPQQKINPADYDFHLLSAAFFFSTNRIREKHKVKPLAFSAALRDAATLHTHEMVAKNFFSHYNNTSSKIRTPKQRLLLFTNNRQTGLSGENCDMNFMEPGESLSYIQLAERITESLYESPPHQQNMLEKGFRYAGCAVIFEKARGSNEAVYLKATQDFSSSI